ncbi:hypothetical protein PMZ80_005742 [Knufia obscura]|uniref:Uncharacterized protein n=2 Tax=Knufia TaxID=430999 RepID=A0AAN8I6D4_9EURO|nr:hypothetical protein PMZ80_005742 [Knufia obscura]KAK5954409.1 hypothetical protein OHC33_004131 [Knufia fluminis]
MAHSQSGSAPAKVSSYARIAAMPVPSLGQNNANNVRNDTKSKVSGTAVGQQSATSAVHSPVMENKSLAQDHSIAAAIDSIPISIQKLSLQDPPADSTNSEPNADSADSYEEDQSQVSSSSLNKPQSFDTKSLASVTTFAMDDKESIRPDDSASVRAADDENPYAALSRNSSFQHDSEHTTHRSARVFPANVTIPGRRFPTLANPPRFGNLPISPVLECQDVHMPQPSVQMISPDEPRAPTTTVTIPPDEKLLDALASAKERLPLLQLEEKVLMFLNSTSDVLELPPQNSFARLLTHKLADYYSLAHAVNEDNTSVRIFRSGHRLPPTPLAQIVKSVQPGNTVAPAAAAMKIMRREQLGNRQFSAGNSTAPSSSVPSKATSENGVEGPSEDGLTSPTESTPSRDKSKLTREEREAQYKAARERIFADFQESMQSESASNEENSASMSRSSSSSGKKKIRRNKQPKDDSFEARSAFVQSWTPMQAQYASTYVDPSMPTNYPVSPVSYDQSMYGATPTQSFPGFDSSMQYANMQGYNPGMMPQYNMNEWQAMQSMQMQNPYFMYPQAAQYTQSANMMLPNAQTMQGQMPDWYPNQGQNFMSPTYMGPMSPFSQQNVPDQRDMMQNNQYGQQHYQRGYSRQSAHGNQGGLKRNKSLFNPQTRSFVPNSTDGRVGGRQGRQKNQARHSLNSNMHTPASTLSGASTTKEDSLKSKYGAPSSLPKKPPPSEVRGGPEVVSNPANLHHDSTTPTSTPLVVNGLGQAAA